MGRCARAEWNPRWRLLLRGMTYDDSVASKCTAILYVVRSSHSTYILLLYFRPMLMKTRCCQKKFELQRYPPQYFCTARYEHKSFKINSCKPSKKPGKKHSLLCVAFAMRFHLRSQQHAISPAMRYFCVGITYSYKVGLHVLFLVDR